MKDSSFKDQKPSCAIQWLNFELIVLLTYRCRSSRQRSQRWVSWIYFVLSWTRRNLVWRKNWTNFHRYFFKLTWHWLTLNLNGFKYWRCSAFFWPVSFFRFFLTLFLFLVRRQRWWTRLSITRILECGILKQFMFDKTSKLIIQKHSFIINMHHVFFKHK